MSNTFAIDLGTYTIKIFNAAADQIHVQKNMIAIEDRNRVIAYGDSAYEMYEKAPANISVSSPLSSGVIADINNMEILIRLLMKDIQKGYLRGADYFISIPTDVTEVEKRAFYDLLKDAGIKAKKIMAVDRAVADALGMGIDVKNSQGVLVVDVGFDTTEISVLSLGGIVLSRLIKTGGHSFDTTLVNAVRREFNLVIGMKTAESVRIAFHEADPEKDRDKEVSVFGRDIVTGLPRERKISYAFASDSLHDSFLSIAESIRVTLERTPPELAADIYRHGVFLTGGASTQAQLWQMISDEVRLPVNIAKSPVNSAVLGIAQVIRKSFYRPLAYTIEGLSK